MSKAVGIPAPLGSPLVGKGVGWGETRLVRLRAVGGPDLFQQLQGRLGGQRWLKGDLEMDVPAGVRSGRREQENGCSSRARRLWLSCVAGTRVQGWPGH